MEDWQQRVVDEKAELDEKLSKLQEFIEFSPSFSTLETRDARLLMQQEYIMRNYSDILAKRIERFS